ncbi:sigma 54-interacting transcriptional regulator [Sedimentibacter sp. MB31-C6]|uniref:sigma 54-interacting transcriptional regulator n=1 Tax=Sedimentibacter sp. MB31-C6 TaxID=3109366 RepID=UPI002DDC9C89|nr:sigma 54-interacting transcriptional regulator [Sedimentibacter sp. MB36-C1]WSI03377.1 sigma 54-interacting transcriptional regulator [Sedimentibacter sp. MB36-C1]
MYKIAVIYSAYPEMKEIAKEFNKIKDYHIKVEEVVLDEAVEVAKNYEAQNYDIIISRGITGALIRKAINIPVINIEVTTTDLLITLLKAKQYSKNIFVLLYDDIIISYDFSFIRELLDLSEDELTIYEYKTEDELKRRISHINNDHIDCVIVGIGAYTIDIARSYNMKSLMVYSNRETIYKAFEQAASIIDITKKHIQVSNMTNSFAKELKNGIVFTDIEENIIFITDILCSFVGINKGMYIGRSLSFLTESTEFFNELSLGKNNYTAEYNRKTFNVAKIQLSIDKDIIGYAITVKQVDKEIRKNTQSKEIEYKNEGLGLKAKYNFEDIIGQSNPIIKLIERAKSYSKSDANILIVGESGTGKELLASSIHNYSNRSNGPFVAINCAALPQSLLESELFGYEEGSFTGAKKGGKVGIFELAENGTVFLDEVSEISLSAQAQLLRVLQEKTIMRIGANKMIPINARIIAATNADLQKRIKSGTFREDLFHRLNVLNLKIPPLRERKDDIILLINRFLELYSYKEKLDLPHVFVQKLKNYRWHGNIRELQNFVEKFVILSNDFPDKFKLLEELYHDLISYERYEDNNINSIDIKISNLKDMEMQIIKKLYNETDNKINLARKLGISRTSLWNKLKEMELE